MKQYTTNGSDLQIKYKITIFQWKQMPREYIPSIASKCSPDSSVVMVLAVGRTVWLDGSHMKISVACTTIAVKIIAGSATNYEVRPLIYKFCQKIHISFLLIR
jgi:hypothetical protein